MNTRTLSRPIPLHRPVARRGLDAATHLARHLFAWWQASRAVRAEMRAVLRAERELAVLSPRTLQDIGAPQGLAGQRRWQEEQEAAQLNRLLDLRGG